MRVVVDLQGPIDAGKIERLGLLPEIIEPGASGLDLMRRVGAEIEFEVVEEARRREVGGAGEDARLVAEDERLAVEELAPVDLDLGRRAVEERDEALDRVDRLGREGDQVTIGFQ